MDAIRALLKLASSRYNKFQPHHDHCRQLVIAAHEKLRMGSTYRDYGVFAGKPAVSYAVFEADGSVSRPVRPDLFIPDLEKFGWAYDELTGVLADTTNWPQGADALANAVTYTSVMSVACCFDLWQRGSRKTPGTFFEIFMASLLQQVLPKAVFTKHIPLAALLHDPDLPLEPDTASAAAEGDEEAEKSSVSTDLVVGAPGKAGGLVIPLKITTRERIVQPFAHQRILDAAFGEGSYQSMIVCISETQLDDKTSSVKQVCVPGTVKLFQKYLAPVAALYYCDIPQRYAAADMQKIVPVRSVGDLFRDVAVAYSELEGKA
jgi:hypothetical protein